MLADAQLLHHIENPDHIGVTFVVDSKRFEELDPWADLFDRQRAIDAVEITCCGPAFASRCDFDITFKRFASSRQHFFCFVGQFSFAQRLERFGVVIG